MIEPIFLRHDLADLKSGLEIGWRTQLEANHNLVNAETPGFSPRNTDFRALLLTGQEPRGEAFKLYLEEMQGPQKFNLEAELRRLSESALTQAAAGRLLSRRYQDLRNVMREGR